MANIFQTDEYKLVIDGNNCKIEGYRVTKSGKRLEDVLEFTKDLSLEVCEYIDNIRELRTEKDRLFLKGILLNIYLAVEGYDHLEY